MPMVHNYKSILLGSKLTQNINDHCLDSKFMNLLPQTPIFIHYLYIYIFIMCAYFLSNAMKALKFRIFLIALLKLDTFY